MLISLGYVCALDFLGYYAKERKYNKQKSAS